MIPKRILVALDASPLSLAAADEAAALAERWGASLAGVYVEDVNLVRLAEQSAGLLVSVLHARRQADHRPLIAQALKLQRAAAERGFRARIARRRMAGHFDQRHGQVVAEVLAAAAEADLLVLGWHGRDPADRSTLGEVARRVAEAAPLPVLILRRPLTDRPFIAVLAGDAEAAALAASLAGPVHPVTHPGQAGPDSLLVTGDLGRLAQAAGSVLVLARKT